MATRIVIRHLGGSKVRCQCYAGGHDLAVLAPQHGLARPTSEAPQEYRELGTASVGTLLGAALGAAVGGWRGAAIGGASGLALGGATGAQADAQCQRIAYQQAAQMAEAAQVRMMAEAAAHNVAPSQVAYQSVDYVTPSTGVHHKVTPLNSYTNPATKEQCSVLKDVSFGPGGGVSNTTSHQFCTGANGQAA